MDGKRGLLINYEYCTGCHSCEIACQVEHGFGEGRWGIKIQEIGPWQIEGDSWQLDYVPVPTDQCDLCAGRLSKGKDPTCVHHCQADVMRYGTIEELSKRMLGMKKSVIFMPKAGI